ncbi:alpha/beta hydrolase [Amycolatopsis sp. NPDC051061]|uniref:esterase/lipase family protein n=1 Tax=Amycolatopsis sp. NPDC051061 TaxID=3155042 RepID=UPI00341AE803
MVNFSAGSAVDLGNGVRLRAVNVSGEARRAERARDTRAPAREAAAHAPQAYLRKAGTSAEVAELLGDALDSSEMRLHTTVGLPRLSARPGTPAIQTRGAAPSVPHLQLEVAAPARGDEGQVILEVDTATGHARWHLPRIDTVDGRRAAGKQRFDIPADRFGIGGAEAGLARRGLVGFGISKVLHVLRFPVEFVAGQLAEWGIRWWEGRHRPHMLRTANPDGTAGAAVDTDRLAQLGAGPYLVFVHGTFSTSAAFTGLHADFAQWHAGYRGRLLLFDHPTVATTPAENARWLLDCLPDDRVSTVDVVTHSRGGLVARQLVRQPASDRIRMRRLVQVASPNAGTKLASPENLSSLVDAFTNLLSLIPDAAGGVALPGVFEVVKQLAVGALSDLDGLAAMDPADEALRALNDADAQMAAVHAITSDYEPAEDASLAQRTLDTIVDALFASGNDLVVPFTGMSNAGKFVVADPFAVTEPSVSHCGYFGDERVRTEIQRCLALPETLPFG